MLGIFKVSVPFLRTKEKREKEGKKERKKIKGKEGKKGEKKVEPPELRFCSDVVLKSGNGLDVKLKLSGVNRT